MERLEKASPSISLSEEQKKEIAEVDSVYRAKIAEKEVFLKDQIRKAQTAGNLEEAESLEKQLASETRRLQERVRNEEGKVARRLSPKSFVWDSRLTSAAISLFWTPTSAQTPAITRGCSPHRVLADRGPENQACARA